MGLRLGFFYVVVYGSSIWVLSYGYWGWVFGELGAEGIGCYGLGFFRWVFPMGLSVGLGFRHRLLRFGC